MAKEPYVLGYLRQPPGDEGEHLDSEFRLIVSGFFYRAGSHGGHSVFNRVLMKEPFKLFVATSFYEDARKLYPQELALRIRVRQVVEDDVRVTTTLYPDYEIVHDLAAMLTLLCRRLVTVAGRVSVTDRTNTVSSLPPEFRELPSPLATTLKLNYWAEQPSIAVYKKDTEPVVSHYRPNTSAVDGARLAHLLSGLPKLAAATPLVLAARLYAAAMEQVHEHPGIAYLLLTQSAEALATVAVAAEDAAEEADPSKRPAFVKLAESMALTTDQRTALYRAAIDAKHKARFKFITFLKSETPDAIWTKEDDLFKVEEWQGKFLPTKEKFKEAIDDIYDQRSAFVHRGQDYPQSIAMGLAAFVSQGTIHDMFKDGGVFPPFVWFERVVNAAICNYWERMVGPMPPQRKGDESA